MADESSRQRWFEDLGDRAMPGHDRAEIGRWVVRADLGATGRANSCWVIGAPETGIGSAIDEVEAWYRQRELPPLFQVYAGNDLVVNDLLRRGYVVRPGSLVMSSDGPTFGDAGVPEMIIAETPTAEFAGLFDTAARVWECQRTTLPQRFATASRHGETVSGGMVVVDGPWAGIFMVRTAPEHRQSGWASAVMSALVAEGRGLGAEKVWLQVMPDNSAAIALYEQAGFNTEHAYSYYAR